MTEHATFLDLVGVDEALLNTKDDRSITLVEEDERPVGRLFRKKDGRIVLRVGNLDHAHPEDFKVKVRN